METLKQQRKRAAKPLMWIGVGSIVMGFAGLTSGYVVSRSHQISTEQWVSFELPTMFTVSTVIILLSSLTLWLAKRAIASGNESGMKALLGMTFALGLGFVVTQFMGWNALKEDNIYLTGPSSFTSGSWVYMISIFHILHVLGGIIGLMVTLTNALIGKYTKEDHNGIGVLSIYWHFVDLLWLYLFLFMSVFR